MSKTFSHKCIKPHCPNTYTDIDPDAYFCPTCIEAKKAVAKRIDAKMSTVSRQPVESELQRYERLRKEFGTQFIPLKSL